MAARAPGGATLSYASRRKPCARDICVEDGGARRPPRGIPNRMTPRAFHVPQEPSPVPSQSSRGIPPVAEIVLSLPSAKNPIVRPSGDQKGTLAPTVFGKGRRSGSSSDRTQSCPRRSPTPLNVTASRRPSGERARWLCDAPAGNATARTGRLACLASGTLLVGGSGPIIGRMGATAEVSATARRTGGSRRRWPRRSVFALRRQSNARACARAPTSAAASQIRT